MTIQVGHGESPFASFYSDTAPWRLEAVCLTDDIDPETFFDNIDKRQTRQERRDAIEVARSICRSCPVRKACLDQAMTEETGAEYGRFGFRGCLTWAERNELARRGGRKGRDPATIRFDN
jgi:hypothetical protein